VTTTAPHLVVIASVEWRFANFMKLVKSLGQQTRLPEFLLVVLDGYSETGYRHVVNALEGTPGMVVWNPRKKGPGHRWVLAVEMLGRGAVPEDTILTIIDDDFLIMPDYLRTNYERVALAKTPTAIGWLGEVPTFISWTAMHTKDIPCISIGAGLLTCRLKDLRGIDAFPDRDMYFRPPGDDEALVSYWLWKNGVKLIRPRGIALVHSVAELQHDPRASFVGQSVYRHKVLRMRLKEKYGWSTYQLPPELLVSHDPPPEGARIARWPRKDVR
jgi:hypothetical protein